MGKTKKGSVSIIRPNKRMRVEKRALDIVETVDTRDTVTNGCRKKECWVGKTRGYVHISTHSTRDRFPGRRHRGRCRLCGTRGWKKPLMRLVLRLHIYVRGLGQRPESARGAVGTVLRTTRREEGRGRTKGVAAFFAREAARAECRMTECMVRRASRGDVGGAEVGVVKPPSVFYIHPPVGTTHTRTNTKPLPRLLPDLSPSLSVSLSVHTLMALRLALSRSSSPPLSLYVQN